MFLSDARLKVRSGRRLVLPYVATADADVTLAVRKRRKRVARVRGTAKAGRNTLRWRAPRARKLRPGRFKAVLKARGADGQRARDAVRLKIKK